MFVAIYLAVIVLVALAIVLFFVLKNKKDKKRLNSKLKENQTAVETLEANAAEIEPLQSEESVETKEEPEQVAEFEEFSLDSEEKTGVKLHNKYSLRRTKPINPFDLEDEEEIEEDEENFDEEDENLNNRFEEYRKFLDQNFDFDDEEELEQNENELDALADFDFDSLKGKSEVEIAEIIKDLPPKAQELLMADILARKNFDEKED